MQASSGLVSIALLLLVILKLCGTLAVPWMIVLTPIWLPTIIITSLIIIDHIKTKEQPND